MLVCVALGRARWADLSFRPARFTVRACLSRTFSFSFTFTFSSVLSGLRTSQLFMSPRGGGVVSIVGFIGKGWYTVAFYFKTLIGYETDRNSLPSGKLL